jgi:hypothetical protein
VLATTTTDANGKYSFTNLAAGTYYVQFMVPAGYVFTTKNASGSTTANDSNVNVSTGKTDAITLAAGQTDNTIDAGLKVSTVAACTNGLLQNPSFESGINGWTVESGYGNTTANYAVDGSNVGYTWWANGAQGRMTQKVTATAGKTYSMSFWAGTHGINNHTAFDNNQTVEIRFYNASNTDLGSAAIFTVTHILESNNKVGGPYTLSATAPAGTTYLKVILRDTTSSSQPATKADALCLTAATTQTKTLTGSIGAFVWNDLNQNGIQESGEAGLAGVTVKLLGSNGTKVLATTKTDANGHYSFSNLPAGKYYIEVMAPSGYKFTTKNGSGLMKAIMLTAGQTEYAIDAGLIQK